MNVYGYTISYSNKKLSSTRAQAITSCGTATNVYAEVTVIYRVEGVAKTKTATGTGRVATSAVADVGNGTISAISSYHKAWVSDQGLKKLRNR